MAEKVIVGRHGWRDEVQVWSRPWDYEAWKEAVCAGRYAHENHLRAYYAGQWEPDSCAEYMVANKVFCKPPKPPKPPKERVVTLDDAAINRRFAMCLWRECVKLLTRRMTPSARQIVVDMEARMRKHIGVELNENSA